MREMNHTGYAQILEESNNGSLVKSYVIGDDILSQSSSVGVRHFLYDGHGSTRMLADTTGAITSRYDFDAYGIMVGGNPNLANPAETDMLYSGEQFDADLQMQYLRARFYDQNTGRFNALDPFAGNNYDPQSLHKYGYCHSDPVNNVDTSGAGIEAIGIALGIAALILGILFVAIPALNARYISSWGVHSNVSSRRIALVQGAFTTVDQCSIWYTGAISLQGLANDLRKAGHTVDLYQNPDENELVDILNSHELVGILAHGSNDVTDKNNKPFGGFLLGGTKTNANDLVEKWPAGATKEQVPAEWVTANELDGRINNPTLEVAAASCRSAITNRLYMAIGGNTIQMYIGTSSARTNFGTGRTVLAYIVDRANGLSIDQARDNATSRDTNIIANPTEEKFK